MVSGASVSLVGQNKRHTTPPPSFVRSNKLCLHFSCFLLLHLLVLVLDLCHYSDHGLVSVLSAAAGGQDKADYYGNGRDYSHNGPTEELRAF